MNICIGIISYFPDNQNVINERSKRLNKLLLKLDSLFKLPIIIVAQNWQKVNIPKLNNSNIILIEYKNALGITEARRALRNYFINSNFDYLIMLDDDSDITGDPQGIANYLNQIKANPGKYGIFKKLLLKLFAISKEMYSLVDFPKGEPSKGDFFEDMYLIMYLEKKYPEKKFVFSRTGIMEHSNSSNDSYSTWYNNKINKRKMGDKTREMIKEV